MSWMRTALVILNGTTGSPTSLFKNADKLSVCKTEPRYELNIKVIKSLRSLNHQQIEINHLT